MSDRIKFSEPIYTGRELLNSEIKDKNSIVISRALLILTNLNDLNREKLEQANNRGKEIIGRNFSLDRNYNGFSTNFIVNNNISSIFFTKENPKLKIRVRNLGMIHAYLWNIQDKSINIENINYSINEKNITKFYSPLKLNSNNVLEENPKWNSENINVKNEFEVKLINELSLNILWKLIEILRGVDEKILNKGPFYNFILNNFKELRDIKEINFWLDNIKDHEVHNFAEELVNKLAVEPRRRGSNFAKEVEAIRLKYGIGENLERERNNHEVSKLMKRPLYKTENLIRMGEEKLRKIMYDELKYKKREM